MVIEVSGVQFGLKSYTWFQSRTSAQCEFTSMLSQTKIVWHEVQLPVYYNHFKVAELGRYQYSFHLVAGLLKSGTKKAFTSHFEPETNDAI